MKIEESLKALTSLPTVSSEMKIENTNTKQYVYFSQKNLSLYLNYLIVGERETQIKGSHHYQGQASSTRKKLTSAIPNKPDHGISAIQLLDI